MYTQMCIDNSAVDHTGLKRKLPQKSATKPQCNKFSMLMADLVILFVLSIDPKNRDQYLPHLTSFPSCTSYGSCQFVSYSPKNESLALGAHLMGPWVHPCTRIFLPW